MVTKTKTRRHRRVKPSHKKSRNIRGGDLSELLKNTKDKTIEASQSVIDKFAEGLNSADNLLKTEIGVGPSKEYIGGDTFSNQLLQDQIKKMGLSAANSAYGRAQNVGNDLLTRITNKGEEFINKIEQTAKNIIANADRQLTDLMNKKLQEFEDKTNQMLNPNNYQNGGNVIPNMALNGLAGNAAEIHNIKMAQPQTYVGGRRRKRHGTIKK